MTEPGTAYERDGLRLTVIGRETLTLCGRSYVDALLYECNRDDCRHCRHGDGHRSIRQSFLGRVQGWRMAWEQLPMPWGTP